jgi:cyclophilin family peptidyl-prolyl cis-trans isomerase/HEAT repeat protein
MAVGSWVNVAAWAAAGCLILATGCSGTPERTSSPLEPLHRATGVAAAVEEMRSASAAQPSAPGAPARDDLRLMPRDMLTDTRDDGSLVAGLSHGDANWRALAARGLARHENETAGPVLLARASQESDPEVLAQIAFALGQRGEAGAGPRLGSLLDHAEPAVRAAAAAALGKLADDQATDALVTALTDPEPDVRGAAALALFRLDGLRYDHERHAGEDSLVARDAALAEAALHDGDPGVRWRALYTLAGLRPRLGYQTVLRVGLKDTEPLCRVFAVRGLVSLMDADDPPEDSLFRLLADGDDRVVIEAISAVARGGDPAPLLNLAETHSTAMVRAAAASALGTRLERDDLDADQRLEVSNRLAAVAQGDASRVVRRQAATTLVHGHDERRATFFLHKLGNSDDARDRERAAQLLADEVLADAASLRTLRADKVPAVAAAALIGPYENETARNEHLLAALGSDDTALISVAAAAVEQDALAGLASAEVMRALATALDRATGPELKEARQVLRRALGLSVMREREAVAPSGRLLDRLMAERRVARQDPRPRVVLETSQGNIELELLRTEAPRHVESFLELAAEGFYDGLDIHRVVPNFVVQGLCPRGDGFGTGGRRLPDEINPMPYLTGTLGMPNAGEPHTGGCQIFMTHLPTPHLDGRYTVFGRVTSGLNVMARLEIGDTIHQVRRLP